MRTHLRAMWRRSGEDSRIVKFRQVAFVLSAAFIFLALCAWPAAAQQERTPEESLRLAQSAVAAGDLDGAREIVTAAFGADALTAPDARPPRITQSLLHVENARGRRTIAVELVDAARGESAAAVAREAAGALGSHAPVIVSGRSLTITLSYGDTPDLLAQQDRLAAALPDLPELALLRSALSTRHLAWPLSEGLVSLQSGYEERVDTTAALRTWDIEAARLEAAAEQAEAAGDADGLNGVRAAVWRGDARLWRDLGALSRAVYRAQVDEQGAGPEWIVARVHQVYSESSLRREWSVRPGETRQLQAAILGWRWDRLALAAALAVVVVIVVFVVAALVVR